MPNLDEFFPKPEPNAAGAFDCQKCDETVFEAHLDMTEGVLTYECKFGHKSKVEL